MESHVTDVLREVTSASDEGSLLFPQVVERLVAAGVERYHADLVIGAKIYYRPGGDWCTLDCHRPGAPAEEFDAAAVEAAVRASQRNEIKYREFCSRIAAAGCAGYFVSLAGRRATYYGRTGETHVELFPGDPALPLAIRDDLSRFSRRRG